MTVRRMEHVGIVVDDLEAATAFFMAIGLTVQGEAPITGAWADRTVGLTGIRAQIAMLETPDGDGRIELSRFWAPASPAGDPTAPPNTPGLRHVAFSVDDLDGILTRLGTLGGELVGEVGQYGDRYRLAYVRGPAGVIVELAEPLG